MLSAEGRDGSIKLVPFLLATRWSRSWHWIGISRSRQKGTRPADVVLSIKEASCRCDFVVDSPSETQDTRHPLDSLGCEQAHRDPVSGAVLSVNRRWTDLTQKRKNRSDLQDARLGHRDHSQGKGRLTE